jgi:peptidoglycan hydrolase-like protein with peptidoglycan-binding domain
MKVRVAVATGFALGALSLTACGPASIGGAGAISSRTAPTTAAAASSAVTTAPDASPSTTTTTTEPSPTTTEPSPTTTAATTAPAPAPSPTAAPAYLMTTGSTSDQVRELQSRLKQLEWYDGDVTGTYDDPTTAGVRGFQSRRGMAETGSVDTATWSSLRGMTRQPTDDEMHNRLTPGPALLKQGATGAPVRDLQARLKQIGWWSGDVVDQYNPATVQAVKSFQTKRDIPVTGEVDQRTIDKLNAMTRQPTSDELNNVKPAPAPAPPATGLDPRCLTGRVLCISKATRSLTWVIDGQPQMKLDVRFGSENNPTREGVFSVYIKYRDWTSTLYGSKMPYSMFFSGGEAVHYSSDFAARGYAGASHGCVNVRDLAGIASLFDQVNLGDKVVVS